MRQLLHTKHIVGMTVTLLVGLTTMSPCSALPVDLGEAEKFVLLGLNGGTVKVNSATSIQGDVGYGNGVTSHYNKKVQDFVGSAYVHSGADFEYDDKNFQPTGGIHMGSIAPAVDTLLD